jgi:hypothetical protein
MSKRTESPGITVTFCDEGLTITYGRELEPDEQADARVAPATAASRRGRTQV